MAKNSTVVGLGDKWVTSYPLNKIEKQDIKDAIKGALNAALSCRVWINTTRKSCEDGRVLFAPMSSSVVALSGEMPEQARMPAGEVASSEIAFPVQRFERPSSGEGGYTFLTTLGAGGGRECCKIMSIHAAPIPLARLTVVVQLANLGTLGAAASLTFDAKAQAEVVGLDYPNECDLHCGPDTMTGSVDMVIDGSAVASIGFGPFGTGVAFKFEQLRIAMGDFSLTCGKDVTLT